jgi:hypothetical protein
MKNPASWTRAGGELVTPTGIESATFQAFTEPDAAPRGPGQGGTELDRPHAAPPTGLDVVRPAEVVTPLGAYLEAVARLAAEATARGDLEAARALLEAAERVVGERG